MLLPEEGLELLQETLGLVGLVVAVLSFRTPEALIKTTLFCYSHTLWKYDFPFSAEF